MNSKSFYVNIESDLLFDERISSITKIIYAIISNYSNNENGYCYLKYDQLAEKMKISKRSLYRHTQLLINYNYLTIIYKNNRSYLMPVNNTLPQIRSERKKTDKQLFEYDWLNSQK